MRVTSRIAYLVLLQYLVQLIIFWYTPWSYRPDHLRWCGPCTILWYRGFIPPQLVPERHIFWCDTPSWPSPNSEAWVLDVFDKSKRHPSSRCKCCCRRSRLSEECMVLLRKEKDFSFLGSVSTWVSVKKCKRVLKRSIGDHQRRRGRKTSTFTARWSVLT
jgi:hypothetical protein